MNCQNPSLSPDSYKKYVHTNCPSRQVNKVGKGVNFTCSSKGLEEMSEDTQAVAQERRHDYSILGEVSSPGAQKNYTDPNDSGLFALGVGGDDQISGCSPGAISLYETPLPRV